MSYISSADAAAIRTMHKEVATAASPRRPSTGLPVGPALEITLFLATSTVVSLVTCTGIAALLLN